ERALVVEDSRDQVFGSAAVAKIGVCVLQAATDWVARTGDRRHTQPNRIGVGIGCRKVPHDVLRWLDGYRTPRPPVVLAVVGVPSCQTLQPTVTLGREDSELSG